MKLSECLNDADISTLQKIAKKYNLPCSRNSKMALLQEILFTFRDPEFLKEHISHWQRGREEAVLRLCLEPKGTFSKEELLGIFQTCGSSDQSIEEVVSEGWLYPTTRNQGRLMYYIPDDLRVPFRSQIVRTFSQQLKTSEEGPLTFRDEGLAMARDLDVFLEYLNHHTVRLTNDGSMYKKNLQQLLELLEVPEQPLQGGWRFGYGRRFHDYPDRFALLYDYAYQQHLVEEAESGELTSAGRDHAWFQASETERQRGLVRFYLSSYRRPIPRLPQIVQLIAWIAERWVHGNSMFSALNVLVREYYYDSAEQVWQKRILNMLMHLGLIRTGFDENDEVWFQITKLGQQLLTPDAIPQSVDEHKESSRILIVQPNFEIVVTADQPLVTQELAMFTELKQAGALRVYRLTEDTVQRGLANSGSIADWIDFVDKYSQTPIPGNVERTLREWEHRMSSNKGTLTS
ncbi:helicase-associated domain-containing protein [Alicyclobacillus tolerans]|uniref:helicase-associated domain-containing protein n=1 Tax=Alicyclobacillus tolerans TaxID=90970 RepID=UPI001F1B7ACE|nr:helicase-associated domain-containing protein [Alicyclobacillus tolerans]MCF8563770.1 helicase-associated domain-containing protein [Alicyclobacillus tolerans]